MSTHINAAERGDIAESVLLPGDPLRAKFIAENFLENARCYSEVRNMLGFTGTYKGVPVCTRNTDSSPTATSMMSCLISRPTMKTNSTSASISD